MPPERVGLLIIRAWVEEGSPAPLRARVRWTDDVTRGLDHEVTATDVATVVATIEGWLDDVLTAAPADELAEGSAEDA